MFSRFGDSTRDYCNFIRGSQSGIASDKTPFFAGKNVDQRMSEIRPYIREIRQNWNDFDNYISNLEKLFFKENEDKYKGKELFRERLSKFRDWIDRDSKKINKSQNLEYGAIKFYTSRDGYELIFRTMNKMFRDESEFTKNNFKSLVFLVELLNIDLYNYNKLNPGVSDFKDINRVYRGLNMSQKEFEFIKEFMEEQDVKRRYISTPLGFLSASFKKGVAHSFIETVEDERCPVILETNIISLSSERLEIYENKYPSSIVSPICATKIDLLSDFPEER
ncbi:MAG: hypothetical protein F6K65_32760 [Moorea sp. SIO3C2]|nr:hypothetical protein [Moorena sp. SIO3C2]